jgi:Domain of unknown function (DUF389)
MHRAIEITVSPEYTDRLIEELRSLEHVIGLSVLRGASLKPKGDVLVANVLNRGADDVMRCVQRAMEQKATISVVTAELASMIDPQHKDQVKSDIDEEIWEEMETGLLHQSRVTSNFLTLMAMGGAIAAVGLVSEPVPQVILWIAASIIAPTFEPLAKIPLGLVLRRWDTALRAFISFLAGYAVLILSAMVMFFVLSWIGATTAQEFAANTEVERMLTPSSKTILVSACAALAGITITAAYREIIIAGPVIALVLVPVSAAIGAGMAAWQPSIIYAALVRLGIDVLLILVLSALFIFFKQVTVHRRSPIV